MKVFRFCFPLHAILAVLLMGLAFARATNGQTQSSNPPTLDIQTREMIVSVAYPLTWSVGPQKFLNGSELFSVPAAELATANRGNLAHMIVSYERYPSHTEALTQLKNIANEEQQPANFITVGGWPALERRFIAPTARPGNEKAFDLSSYPPEELRITTAIAAGNLLVRMETRIPITADPSVADDAQAIGQAVGFSVAGDPTKVSQELLNLQKQSPTVAPTPTPAGPESNPQSSPTAQPSGRASPGLVPLSGTSMASAPGLASQAYIGVGEFETTASSDGRSIVIGGNGDAAVSGNAGQTFSTNVSGVVQNDVSLAVGASGNFYAASIGTAPGSNTTRIARSSDGGTNFIFLINAVSCSTNGPGCTLPDQEHIAADRFNIAPGGGDQVYSVYRNCGAGGCTLGAMITFSTNSGVSWSPPMTVDSGGDFPRITVGQDGFVYVVTAIGSGRDGIRVKKFSSAASGLALQTSVDIVGTGGATGAPGSVPGLVSCPVPGLDRCNDGNVLDSPTVAVDDTNPWHVYVAFARTTAPGNEDVFVRDSIDGGTNFPPSRVVRLNMAVTGRRYMPWVTAVGGAARVSWYDRRASSGSLDNSLTDYYSGSAFLDGSGNLVAGSEFKVSPVSDSNCLIGWCGGGGVRSTNDSEYCSIQPEFAGNCSNTTTKCDFSTPTNCAAMVACLPGDGCPKYGDYNGIAAAAGRVFNAWTSGTNPQGVRNGLTVYFAAKIVCCVPQIQVPSNLSLPATCVGTTNFTTLLVCNTGKEDLEIGTITSSSAQIAVVPPSSGYPVIVSPDFCFPFQVQFAPTSTGTKSATLTIPSNDSASPSVNVFAAGQGTQQNITTSIADGGRFGDVCSNAFEDLNLTINNSGGCDLLVTNISSSSTEFLTPSVATFPLVVQAGTSVAVPIRLQPTSLGPKSANITVSSNDPDTPNQVIMVSGNTPPGSLRLTGSTDFGDVCAGALAEKQLSICNVGTCNLNVSSVGFVGQCLDFALINNPFPAAVSPDFCANVTIRFTPTSCGAKSCTLRITTDDPSALTTDVTITANTPCPTIDVAPDVCFPPTVIQSVGACSSSASFPILNKGICPVTINSITVNSNAYSFAGLPSFPINLQPGHTVGDGALRVLFAPFDLNRNTLATLSVTYESDPVTHATTTVTRTLNGEGVRTGARVLVLGNGVPLAKVEKIMIQRITGNRNKPLLNTVDSAMNLLLSTVVPAAPCAPFQYHREYSTVSNPIQLLPGSYQITATAYVGSKKYTKAVGFDVQTCTFNPNIVISLP